MTTADALETLAALISSVKTYAAKLPTVVHLSVVSQGMRPTPEAIEAYEAAVARYRERSAGTSYRKVHPSFVESLEAFETGSLLGAIHPLLLSLDHLDRMGQDKEIVVGAGDLKRIEEQRAALHKLLPGHDPELRGAGRGME